MDNVLLTDYLKHHRRELHKIPELSGKEFVTQAYLLAELKQLGYSTKKIGTGIVVDIKGDERKKGIVALRADMDALPIKEENTSDYVSRNEGVMHACGHDGHMAMLLGVAKVLKEQKPVYNTRLIFQPAEEGAGGAESMIEGGCLDGVGEIYGLHLAPELQAGVFASDNGAIFAGAVEFDISFYGKKGHCADEVKVDALAAAVAYANLISQKMQSFGNAIMFLGKISGGVARNVVADKIVLEYTLRFFSQQDKEKITLLIADTLNHIDDTFATEHRVEVRAVYPPLVNSLGAFTIASACNKIVPCKARFTAEDFAFYCQKVAGCFTWLGVGADCTLHSSRFDFDDSVLVEGVRYFLNIVNQRF